MAELSIDNGNQLLATAGQRHGDAPLVTGIADRLRLETASAHRQAERAAMQHLFAPKVFSQARYAGYLGELYPVYSALEAQLERHRDHPLIGPLARPELARTAAIEQDLATLCGPVGPPPPSCSAARYAARIHAVGQEAPLLLIAAIYTRYLGDLYGGQLLKTQIERHLQLADNQGVQSLLFPQIFDLAAFRTRFRGHLNELSLPSPVVSDLIRETLDAFAMSQALFESLSSAL